MKRYVDMNEISDGRLYGLNDMVKADCGDCEGCSACCHGMGTSIVLDPYDLYRMSLSLNTHLQGLIYGDKVELNVVDGLVLPNLKMQGDKEQCGFLNEEGRCSIHPYRPGICRLFPLGRYYEGNQIRYFLQTRECRKDNRGKVKVWKWLDTPESKKYEQYLSDWHAFLLSQQSRIETLLKREQTEAGVVENPVDGDVESATDVEIRQISMEILQRFYLQSYEPSDFYTQFYERLQERC